MSDTGQVSDDDVILRLGSEGDTLEIDIGGVITEVSLSMITNFVFNGGSGDDTLTIDLSGGPLPILITFNGGAGGNDTLHITNFDDASEGFTGYTINYSNPTDGNVQFRNGAAVSNTLIFTGLDPLTIDGTPTDVVFNLPSTSDTNVNLSAIDDDNMILTGSTFESTTFSIAAATSITINANAGNDTIEIDSIAANYAGSLIVNGGAGSDRLIVDLTAGAYLTEGGLTYNGGVGPTDSLIVRDAGDSYETTLVHPLDKIGGFVDFTSEDGTIRLNYTRLGVVNLEGTQSSELIFDMPDTNSSASLSDFGGADGRMKFSSSGMLGATFAVAGIDTLSLRGNGGNDSLSVSSIDVGLTGLIVLEGGTGNDSLSTSSLTVGTRQFGGAGNDQLTGGKGSDTLLGEAGNDILAGGDGNDGLNGGTGNDNLNGGKGSDTLLGGAGKDILIGGTEADVCLGGGGDDIIDGGTAPAGQRDTVAGNAGNDVINDPNIEINEAFMFDFDTLLM
ncbi:MAG: frpC [Planctomycetota bacterium]|nr:MAG: frpC [Planctomycetota bacterium]